jgi:hypothetical protein
MLSLNSISPARVIGVAALVLYSVYAVASGAPGVAAVAAALALFFGRVAVGEPKRTQPKEISASATFLIWVGATVLFGVLIQPLGAWSLFAFVLPVAAVAYWHFGLRGRQALILGIGFLLAFAGALALILAA